ncbi:hypothetical protein E2C01_001638 [Portunus trituberculatus]|uniref:Uncharacterized protein n=1 Tax=Portunus trituberculatus TaxID=210409 RepID=A0A5B7CHP7_PORTR|nr:hypothetical protein [Portunus trituberculatus]
MVAGGFSMEGAIRKIYSLELRQLNDQPENSANGRWPRFVINAVLWAVEAAGGRGDSPAPRNDQRPSEIHTDNFDVRAGVRCCHIAASHTFGSSCRRRSTQLDTGPGEASVSCKASMCAAAVYR